MSRGFVKEEDQEEAPMIPPRAALPEGVINYVTPFGYEQLLAERKQLEEDRKNRSHTHETEQRRVAMLIDGKLNLLKERIASAQILDPKNQPKEEIRFGANVEIKMNHKRQQFQIVGVDEANIKNQKIAFVAPIAKSISGKKVGDKVNFQLGNENRELEILSIRYPS